MFTLPDNKTLKSIFHYKKHGLNTCYTKPCANRFRPTIIGPKIEKHSDSQSDVLECWDLYSI